MTKPQRCYVCKTPVAQPHSFYPGLCNPCGELNHRKRHQVADLRGKIALVTGARVNIGYAVALNLLRSHYTVIATTRFPRDAARRYSREKDFSQWRDRLSLHRLDLRHLTAVEQFAHRIRDNSPRLDILINNAAQTVRRLPAFYRHLRDAERQELSPELQPLLAGNGDEEGLIPAPEFSNEQRFASSQTHFFPPGQYSEDGQQIDLRPFNSWLMKDEEVSLVEVLEVHAINAIAPFLLNSRLKALLQEHPERRKYIINVSSMEGRFHGGDKPWRHPHTNMAKASLHMMTCTCAKEYAKHSIFMNCVDPGWVSFQHPYPQAQVMQNRGVCPPFDAADGAARICDPIYESINEGRDRFGKFFKDYRAVEW